ncbi:MAG: PDZ domain-containing protein, partial [Candidatus Eisenbacteria bacterium]
VDLRLSRLRLMPMTFQAYDGHQVDGLLGYDFFEHFVVAIDYSARSLSLRAPGDRDGGVKGRRLPLILLEDDSGGKVPLVIARITQSGRPPTLGKFILDTGARMALVLNTPYVASHGILEAVPRTITMIVGGGGMVRDLRLPIGRVDRLEIGIPSPLVGFAQDTTGILSATEFDGVVGGELLRRFRVVFDYSAEAVFLEPTPVLAQPFEHDMSGLFVVEDDAAGPRIRDVLEGSPASEAGLKVGDVIVSIDRTPAQGMTLDCLRRRFLNEGRVVAVTVQRGAATIQAKIRLRRLI